MKIELSLTLAATAASFLMSGASALWFTSAKSNDITRLKQDVEAVSKSDAIHSSTLSKLDERTVIILDTVRRLEERR